MATAITHQTHSRSSHALPSMAPAVMAGHQFSGHQLSGHSLSGHSLPGEAMRVAAHPLHYRIAGLAVTMILPALFWVALFAVALPLMGWSISTMALAITGVAIGAFLGSVCAPLLLKGGAFGR